MAGRTSGDSPADFTNGAIEEQQESIATDSGAVEDEQALADIEQTLGDSDQTLSDADQTSSDSDQTSADCDQLAADRDQAASDRDLESGIDPHAHEVSRDIRERTADQREQTSGQRDQTSQARLDAADQRDEIADARDRAALARDHAADARNLAIAQLDAASQQDDDARALTGSAVIVRAAGQRKRAAQRRAQAAEQRAQAGQDRQAAAQDRERAARERRRALVDREALVVELQREQERRDQALRHQHRAEKLAQTLQRSLSPPSLPSIAGLDVAVHYEPFAPEEVGGDFYDLFPLAAGRSGFFLGDVCGKGPDAAAVTSLARYTMRTAAMLHEEPDAILMDLNAALLMESSEPMRTCTAVYGEIDLGTGAAITLAVAGHPSPLIVRALGSVDATPAHGTMLGAVERPAFQTCKVNLDPGDAIIIYSDGILDTEIDGIRVDEQRIAELLSGTPQASAQALVDRLMYALQEIDRPLRDDVAFLALRRTPRHGDESSLVGPLSLPRR